jgi:chromate transporter
MSNRSITPPSFEEVFRTFGRVGLINFGGPAGQIALMHRVLVEEKGWIDDESYLRALNFCTLLPGPEAQQLATYVGWKLYGVRGGLAAGLLFVLPGAAVVLALSILYAYAADLRPVAAALLGVKAAVLTIVVEALLRISKRALNAPIKRAIAVLAFVSLAAFSAPFPAVVLAAGFVGFAVSSRHPDWMRLKPASSTPRSGASPPLVARTIRTLATWFGIWAAPMIVIAALLGPSHVLFEIGVFFSKLATVTFGGAYAVLAYMAQQAVSTHGWLEPKEMVDGLGLAETTPGPLILVTEFVGFLAAFRHPAPFTPLLAGVIGAALTLWVTFAPCFLWIFTAAPMLERLEGARRLQGALAAITAAVVGVIGNLTLWFGLHVLFRRFAVTGLGQIQLALPDLTSLDWRVVALSLLTAVLLFRLHAGVIRTLAAAVVAGLALYAAGAA